MRDERLAAESDELNKAAGEGLRVLREHRGWSKARLGRLLGVSSKNITAYESGKTPIPAAQLLIADKLFRAGGLDFWFWPYSRPELQNNVIRFPRQ